MNTYINYKRARRVADERDRFVGDRLTVPRLWQHLRRFEHRQVSPFGGAVHIEIAKSFAHLCQGGPRWGDEAWSGGKGSSALVQQPCTRTKGERVSILSTSVRSKGEAYHSAPSTTISTKGEGSHSTPSTSASVAHLGGVWLRWREEPGSGERAVRQSSHHL